MGGKTILSIAGNSYPVLFIDPYSFKWSYINGQYQKLLFHISQHAWNKIQYLLSARTSHPFSRNQWRNHPNHMWCRQHRTLCYEKGWVITRLTLNIDVTVREYSRNIGDLISKSHSTAYPAIIHISKRLAFKQNIRYFCF